MAMCVFVNDGNVPWKKSKTSVGFQKTRKKTAHLARLSINALIHRHNPEHMFCYFFRVGSRESSRLQTCLITRPTPLRWCQKTGYPNQLLKWTRCEPWLAWVKRINEQNNSCFLGLFFNVSVMLMSIPLWMFFPLQIEREIDLHSNLRNHFVVGFHGSFQDQTHYYILLELCSRKVYDSCAFLCTIFYIAYNTATRLCWSNSNKEALPMQYKRISYPCPCLYIAVYFTCRYCFNDCKGHILRSCRSCVE